MTKITINADQLVGKINKNIYGHSPNTSAGASMKEFG